MAHRLQLRSAEGKQSLDFVRGAPDGQFQCFVDMDIVLRYILRSMPEHRTDRELRKSQVSGDASERMAKRMRRHTFYSSQIAHAPQAVADRGVRTIPNSGRKQMRITRYLCLVFEPTNGGGSDRPDLCAALRIGKGDVAALGM